MKHNEMLKMIMEQTGSKPTQRELANILNLPLGTVNGRASRNYRYKRQELTKLEDYFGVKFSAIDRVPFLRHSDVIDIINKQANIRPTQSELASILGKPKATISSRAQKDNFYSYAEVEKLKKYYDIPFVKPVKNAVDVKTTLQYIKTLIEDLEQSL
jgi:transcriptional regulator with XRE-family HTH domain